jgi:hypothetical protein
LGSVAAGDALRRFQAKPAPCVILGRAPLRIRKSRQIKTLEYLFDEIEAGF